MSATVLRFPDLPRATVLLALARAHVAFAGARGLNPARREMALDEAEMAVELVRKIIDYRILEPRGLALLHEARQVLAVVDGLRGPGAIPEPEPQREVVQQMSRALWCTGAANRNAKIPRSRQKATAAP